MSWQHRIVRHKEHGGREWLGVHEYFWSEKSGCAWDVTPVVIGDDLEELIEAWALVAGAFDKPIIDYTKDHDPMLYHDPEVGAPACAICGATS